jgi:hypothetical protein
LNSGSDKEGEGHVISFYLNPKGKCAMLDAETGSFEFNNKEDLMNFFNEYQKMILSQGKWSHFKLTGFEGLGPALESSARQVKTPMMSTATMFISMMPPTQAPAAAPSAYKATVNAEANLPPMAVLNPLTLATPVEANLPPMAVLNPLTPATSAEASPSPMTVLKTVPPTNTAPVVGDPDSAKDERNDKQSGCCTVS